MSGQNICILLLFWPLAQRQQTTNAENSVSKVWNKIKQRYLQKKKHLLLSILSQTLNISLALIII